MKIGIFSFLALSIALLAFSYKPDTVYDYTVKDILGNDVSLSKYKGKALLIVNVASKCGFTPQYAELQALYDSLSSEGLEVLAFPANNFMGQEPGSEDEIKSFCTEKYGVTFPMFSKISVKGNDMAPLYKYLTSKKENGVVDAPVKWNFQKFLIGKNGKLIQSFTPATKVTDPTVLAAINKALK